MEHDVELHMCGGISGSARSTGPEQPGQWSEWGHDEFADVELECAFERHDAVYVRGVVGGGFRFFFGDWIGKQPDIDELECGPGVVV
jgi:hypothetical protein